MLRLVILLLLMHLTPAHAENTSRLQASKDFAFCSAFFIVLSRSIPDADKILAGKVKRKSELYAQISVSLANISYFKAELENSRKYLSALTGADELTAAKLKSINKSCLSIDTKHADVLALLHKELEAINTSHSEGNKVVTP